MTVNIGCNPYLFAPRGYLMPRLKSWLKKKHSFRYKDLIVPDVTLSFPQSPSKSGACQIGYYINGHRIYGYCEIWDIWNFTLSKQVIELTFELKLSRHLNMIQKGASRLKPQALKNLIDTTFGVNCRISPLPKNQKQPLVLTMNSLGQVLNQKGKVIGFSGSLLATALAKGQNPMTYAKSLSKKKKKKKPFNPSLRN